MLSAKRGAGIVACLCALILFIVASFLVGSNMIAPARVIEVLRAPDGSFESTIINGQRVPRTILVILVGSALGVAGALMQALTRNPLAEPGLLGVNAGASLSVVLSVAIIGVADIRLYVWFAFLGAAIATVAVYVLGGGVRADASTAKLALAGVAISMAVSSLVDFVNLSNKEVYNEFRFWAAGSVENRGYPVMYAVIGFIALGLILAVITAPGLNAMALGEEAARGLGVNIARLRTIVMVALTLLAGAATAAVGPIMFIGLGVPYIARFFCGPDQRWVIPVSALVAPTVFLGADLLARVVVYPQEIPTGVITAMIGAPIFIAIARQRRIEAL
ncbi:FecCD family ABC transporter permease [Corynebacterium aquatimens]|uniref:Iron complex transport system permease protein n=1 Tax=Corynebacterium aquatimens TaxID=1190508 RepID=A0A931E1F8_9CORY|nr:iron ABC transporter permease [Corynebacterium aquatimens]MBG6121601.1 iron complex transport system permease protein [Corynebacterium aquatimens]WJY65859.1 putative siderophore transport system permease protein YfiZ precursor [Corynebacterium aquatimens]